MPTLAELSKVVIAALAMLIIWGIELIYSLIKALVRDWPWPFNKIASVAFAVPLTLLGSMEHLLLGALGAMLHELESLNVAAAALLDGQLNYALHLNDKTNDLHKAAVAANSRINGIAKNHTNAASIASLQKEVAAAKAAAATADKNVTALRKYVNGAYTHQVTQSIAAAEHKAVTSANSHTTSAIQAENDTLHRRIVTLQAQLGIHIPDAVNTIPIALAGVMSYAAVLEAAATECYNPMCQDYHAAEAALASLMAGLGAAGALAFIARAITDPEGFGTQVAGYTESVGDTAISSLGGILGISIRQQGGE